MFMYVCGHLVQVTTNALGFSALHVDGKFCGIFQSEESALATVLEILPIPEVA